MLASLHLPLRWWDITLGVPQLTLPSVSQGIAPQEKPSMPLIPCHLLGLGVVLSPDPFELIQVMGPKNGPVTCEVVKVVHDDSHKEVNDLRNVKDAG